MSQGRPEVETAGTEKTGAKMTGAGAERAGTKAGAGAKTVAGEAVMPPEKGLAGAAGAAGSRVVAGEAITPRKRGFSLLGGEDGAVPKTALTEAAEPVMLTIEANEPNLEDALNLDIMI